jgi:lysophospholipase L1-like esterase
MQIFVRALFVVTLVAGGAGVCCQADDVATATAEKVQPTKANYFGDLKQKLTQTWPNNRLVRFVFHGHSVPAGYFRTPIVRRFDSYPVLFHQGLCERYPTAVIDVCNTAIGGENSVSGSKRFADDVLTLKPDVVFIDYCLNDRRVGVDTAQDCWRTMVEQAVAKGVMVVLLTPTPDSKEDISDPDSPLAKHAESIRQLAREFELPLVDSYSQFQRLVGEGADVNDYLSQSNHPNRDGHQVVADQILSLFK